MVVLQVFLAQAAVITVVQSTPGTALCPRETDVFVDTLKNTNANIREFSVTTRGSAAGWSVPTPQSFILAPGEQKTVYSYVTPFSNAMPGEYMLELVVSAGGEVKVVEHPVTLKSCYDVTIQSPDVVQEACPSQVARYSLVFTNTGAYQEEFILRPDGPLKALVTLTDTIISLKAGERKAVDAYLVAPVDAGEYGFSVVAAGKSGRSVQTITALLKVQPCYTFNVAPEKQVYSMCEKSSLPIPVEIENRGTVSNNYLVSVAGPAWARVDRAGVTLLAGQRERVNLVMNPEYGVRGEYRLMLEVIPERGEVKAVTDVDVQVRKCHSVDVQVVQNEVQVCADGRARVFESVIKNDGEVAKQYSVALDAPAWVSANAPELVFLNPGEQRVFQITTKPGSEVPARQYEARVLVQATDESSVVAKDSEVVRVNAVSLAACYAPRVDIGYNDLVVYYDSSVTLPVTVQNVGLEIAVYEVVVSGAGANFAKLNPGIVTVAPGKTETVFLYIAPGPHTPLTGYDLEVGVKLADSGILESKKLALRVTDNPDEATKISTVASPEVATWWSRLKAWVKRNFVPQRVEVQVTGQLEPEVVKNGSVQEGAQVPLTGSVMSGAEAWARVKSGARAYRYHILGAVVILLVLVLLSRLGFWEKVTDFFLEEDETPRKNGRKKG